MTRRRKMLTVALIGIGILAVAAGALFALRYYRFSNLRRHVAEAARAAEKLADPRLRRDLKAHADYLKSRLKQARRKDILLGRLDREVSQLRDAARGKVAAPHLLPGHHVIVTVSRVDEAELPTSVTVPEEWNGADPLPLILVLHAAGVREMKDCFPAPAHAGALCVTPLARGSHDYMGVQMTAVEECLADVRRRYPVSRLHVMGSSMGGLGTWLFAQRHIAEVSGISPWMANADPDVWKGLWEPESQPCSPAGRACALAQRARTPIARVGQLAGRPDLPIDVGHGAEDDIVPVGHSDSMVEKLRELGARNVRFHRLDGYGHGGLPEPTPGRIEWLLSQTPPAPERLVAVIPPLTFVADCIGVPPHRVLDPLREATLIVRSGKVEGGSNIVPAADAGPSKWHFPGPAGSAFEHPFSVSVPAKGAGPLGECAVELARLWGDRYGGAVRFVNPQTGFAAFAPRQDERELRSLVAFGSPDENPAVRAALEGVDVRVEARKVTLFGRAFEGEDIGLILLRPHPTDFRAATLVVWGSTPTSYRQLWQRFGNVVHLEGDRGRWWFDYAVFDRRTCGPDTFLAVGFFGHEWRFDPSLLFEGSAELRARMPGGPWALERSGEGRVWLSTLAPDSIESRRGPVGFDRSAGVDAGALMIQGEEFGHGIGVIPPATVRWSLGGRFSQFRAKVGLERTGTEFPARYEAEKVQFEVWADGNRIAASPILSATDGLAELAVDIRGADLLELRAINTTKFVWHYGPAGWGDAELIPSNP